MKPKMIFLISIVLFTMVLTGVYAMMLISQVKQLEWVQAFMPLIVLTGFFIFIISAGLFIYGIVSLIKKQ